MVVAPNTVGQLCRAWRQNSAIVAPQLVIARCNGLARQLAKRDVARTPTMMPADTAFLDLPLARYPRGAYLTFIVTNPQNGNRLRTVSLTKQPGEAAKGRLYALPWRDAGLSQVAVDVTCRPVRGSAYTDHLLLPLSAPAHWAVPLQKN